VKVEHDGTFVVEDEGDGIAPEDLPHVFDRFYRGDPSRSRNTGGTGLGLSICKAIVTRYQGTIRIASQPQAGTRVTVHFPSADGQLSAVRTTGHTAGNGVF
jgi:signal transduction histidine kinase